MDIVRMELLQLEFVHSEYNLAISFTNISENDIPGYDDCKGRQT